MYLTSVLLHHFRSYTQKKFDLAPDITVIIGPNTAGKTNFVESVQLLATGRSFRGPTDSMLIQFDQEIGRVQGLVEENGEKTKLEVTLLSPQMNEGRFGRKFLVNGIARSRMKFVGYIPLVLFRPEELDIVIGGPSLRREFLDSVLEIVDRDYYHASVAYEKALRQRNALLHIAQETGRKDKEQFDYWDDLVISNGTTISEKREELVEFLNNAQKDVFDCTVVYDHSKISKERLEQYRDAEIASGTTLVGPHRDDLQMYMKDETGVDRDIKYYGSRGQQRLVVLQLKMLQIQYVLKILGQRPLLVLDDIFSELDGGHIDLVLSMVKEGQAIITTTHKEFIPKAMLSKVTVIELEKS